jgi:hypothetical protein
VGTAANVGGLAVGPLFAGLLARYLPAVPRLPYEVFAVLLAVAVLATTVVPEGRAVPRSRPRYRPQRLAAPAHARAQFNAAVTGAFMVFTVFGVLAGLAGSFLAGPLHHASPVWAGLAVFLSFGVGALTQVSTMSWSLRRLFALGLPALLLGLGAIVAAAWMRPPSLAVLLAGVVLAGVGSGTIYRGSLTTILTTSTADNRAGALTSFFVAGYVGLSLPVVGAGIALEHTDFRTVLLVLNLVVAAGTLVAAAVLLRVQPRVDSA